MSSWDSEEPSFLADAEGKIYEHGLRVRFGVDYGGYLEDSRWAE